VIEEDVVDRTDEQLEQLAVIGPRGDTAEGDLKSLGQALKQWKETHGYARHICGLDDLLVGRWPQTPSLYLMVPFNEDELYDPVALVYIARGTNREEAFESLSRAIDEHRGRLAYCCDTATYSYLNR
jgi:hypothetical protein